MTINPIKADAEHFSNALSANTFEIPELQRPYAWQERQAHDFVNDVTKLLLGVRGEGDGAGGEVAEHLLDPSLYLRLPTSVSAQVSSMVNSV